MRADIFSGRFSWLHSLDHRKLILVAFLFRLIFACAYDIFVTVDGRDLLLPDSKYYSLKGKYVSLLLDGYSKDRFPSAAIPADSASREVLVSMVREDGGRLPSSKNENTVFALIIGFIYFLFGDFTIWVRIFNIVLSITGTYLLFRIAKRHFGDTAANLFLLVALFLPTQFGYSITMAKDFLRMFVICLILWVVYG